MGRLTVESLDHSIKYCFDRLVSLSLLESTRSNRIKIETNAELLVELYARQDLARAFEKLNEGR